MPCCSEIVDAASQAPDAAEGEADPIPSGPIRRVFPTLNFPADFDTLASGQANDVARLYRAVMPDPAIPLLAPRAQLIAELAKAVHAQKDSVNIK